MKIKLLIISLMFLLFACSSVDSLETVKKNEIISNEDIAINFLKTVETGNLDVIGKYVDEQYVQHNLDDEIGRDELYKLIPIIKETGIKISIKELYKNKNYVVINSEFDIQNTKMIAVNMYRFKEGKIIEHWDIVSELN